MKNILVIGGTRNIGHELVYRLREDGHRVIVLNRGKTPDALPDEIERLRADRTKPAQLEAVLAGRSFEVVVDTTLYKGEDAAAIVRLLNGRVGRYIFLSTGQVYLVREGIERPFRETDYDGRVMPAPKLNTYSYTEWLYGVEKREAEDMLAAWPDFPYTSLRLPMVNSERDPFNRLYGYILRLRDGGPLLVPQTPDHRLRHIYGGDVVQAIMRVINTGAGLRRAFNISQDETVSLSAFLGLLGEILDVRPQVVRVRRSLLEANGFLPDCSPFSERWMSELDNSRSKTELGMQYTPLRAYLSNLVAYYQAHPPQLPASYRRRQSELRFALQTQS